MYIDKWVSTCMTLLCCYVPSHCTDAGEKRRNVTMELNVHFDCHAGIHSSRSRHPRTMVANLVQ